MIKYFFISSLLFIIIFIIKLSFEPIRYTTNVKDKLKSHKIELMKSEFENDFHRIYTNNTIVITKLIAGASLFGVPTVILLLFNGWGLAYTISNSLTTGLGVKIITLSILPHSIELIGIWLAAAVGFYCTELIIHLIKYKTPPDRSKLMKVLYCTIASYAIIAVAAYLESYLTPYIIINYC